MSQQAVFETRLKDAAVAVPLMCCAADMLFVSSHKQIVLAGQKTLPDFIAMLSTVHATFEPNKTVSLSVVAVRYYISNSANYNSQCHAISFQEHINYN